MNLRRTITAKHVFTLRLMPAGARPLRNRLETAEAPPWRYPDGAVNRRNNNDAMGWPADAPCVVDAGRAIDDSIGLGNGESYQQGRDYVFHLWAPSDGMAGKQRDKLVLQLHCRIARGLWKVCPRSAAIQQLGLEALYRRPLCAPDQLQTWYP
jgi:hypothetical protein